MEIQGYKGPPSARLTGPWTLVTEKLRDAVHLPEVT